MFMYVPIVMYGLKLFIIVSQELQCLPNSRGPTQVEISYTQLEIRNQGLSQNGRVLPTTHAHSQ